MVLIRNVFHLKFGKAKEGIAALKEGVAVQKRLGVGSNHRVLTDLTGPYYTLVYEITIPDVGSLESLMSRFTGDKDWQASYQKMSQLVESGHRELYTIVE